MRRFVLVCWFCAAAAHAADSKIDPWIDSGNRVPDLKSLQGQLDPALRQAISDAIKEEPAKSSPFQSAPAFSSANSEILTTAFNEAKLPDCLHSEGLKGQFTFFLTGVLALPFIPIAKLRGTCN